jgi:hypothetical protein
MVSTVRRITESFQARVRRTNGHERAQGSMLRLPGADDLNRDEVC